MRTKKIMRITEKLFRDISPSFFLLLILLVFIVGCNQSGNNKKELPREPIRTVFPKKMIKVKIPESDSSFTFELKSLIEKAYSIEIYYTKGPDHGNWGREYALLMKVAMAARVTGFSGQYRNGLFAHPVVIPSR